MGAVKKLRPRAVQDLWQRQATAAAIQSARKMIGNSVVPAETPIGMVSDEQLGWLLCAGICSWIATRAAQAVGDRGRHPQHRRRTATVGYRRGRDHPAGS
jgi:hypothetical protein